MDARASSGRFGLCRSGARVVLDQSEIDLAVCHVPRRMVTRFLCLGVTKAKKLDIKIAHGFDVFHLQGNVRDPVDFVAAAIELVPANFDQFCDGASGGAELDGDDPWIAHHNATIGFDLGSCLFKVLHFDGEMMDTRTITGRLGLCRGGAGVVLDQSKVNLDICHVPRRVVTRFLGGGVLKIKHLLVKVT